MGNWNKAAIAQAVFDKKQTDAIDDMYDRESETKIKKNVILDENNATKAVEESIDALDFNRYNNNVKKMLGNLLDEAAIYKYNAGDMLDWDSSSWDNNSKGLSEIFSGTKFLGNKGAELKLDKKVVNDIFLTLEEVSRFDYLTKRIVDQLDYLQYPPNVANSGAERFKYQKVMIEDALDNFLKLNKVKNFLQDILIFRQGFKYKRNSRQDAISIQPMGDNKDFSHISRDCLKSVINDNPDAFPEVGDNLKDISRRSIKQNKANLFTIFNEQGIIDDVVFSEQELLKDGDLETPLKEKINLKDGTVDLKHLHLSFLKYDLLVLIGYFGLLTDPDQIVVAKGIERTAKRSAIIFNDIDDVEDTTEGDLNKL